MNILLVALNAKYIHTCPAVYSLKAYACSAMSKSRQSVRIDIAEYTINDRYQDVLAGIMSYHADILGFSTYIWNVDRVHRLIRDIRRIRGNDVQIWAGGPEATWYPQAFLRDGGADLCMLGEGEIVFADLVSLAARDPASLRACSLSSVPGLAFRRKGEAPEAIESTGPAPAARLDEIPFLYRDLSLFENRILYYEASRGCPFGCAYCLSGKEKGIRYRNPETVKAELQFFLDEKVKQVKFIDRTFNANAAFAMEIWTYLRDHDNGVTNFHFEMEAGLMTDEELALLSSLRPGLVQMEIGVQSANPRTLRAVHRSPDLNRIRDVMRFLVRNQNINLHLDLIAGLPFEDLASFRKSFQTVYDMRPNQLQLGFLKLLKGTELFDRRAEYGLICSADAPYEVLKTSWLSFEELDLLHRISDMVEEYVNSQGFRRSLPLAEALFADAFSLFWALADYYREKGYDRNRPSVQKRYEIFTDFIEQRMKETQAFPEKQRQKLLEMIRLDKCLHVHPSRKMLAEGVFDFGDGPQNLCFDYRHCSPVNGEAFISLPGTQNSHGIS